MKKIISLVLLAAIALFALASCAPAEKDYTLAIGMSVTGNADIEDSRNNGKIGANVAVLVLDGDNKIVAARLDTIEYKVKAGGKGATPSLNVTAPTSKMELGDDYNMKGSSELGKEWDEQMKWLESYLVGKTADEVAAMEMDDIKAGCTVTTTVNDHKVAIANAFASTTKTTFAKPEGEFTVGAKIMMTVKNNTTGSATTGANEYKVGVDAEAAGVVVQEGKIVASTLDAAQTEMIANGDFKATSFTYKANASKRAQGEDYMMGTEIPRSWATMADAFCAATVGKAATELADVTAAECTMPYSPATFKANLAAAMGLAR